jgi:2-polyprenyl-3-methyl-5-hydroxy-6-metoxy-1,4-benzoquinol methylase
MENKIFENPNSAYYTQEKRFLFPLIPDGPNIVMDLGCASGSLGRGLLNCGKAREVVGVELFPLAAAEAEKHYKAVHVGDIEELSLAYERYFDIVICGDVLEHLKEPGKVVRKINHWLKKDGLIVCSVPNVRYWRVWRDLVFRGEWEYTPEGIMDHTHLRFFTTASLRRLLLENSFAIEKESMKMAIGPRQEIFHRLTCGLFTEFLGYQILMSARKAAEKVTTSFTQKNVPDYVYKAQ